MREIRGKDRSGFIGADLIAETSIVLKIALDIDDCKKAGGCIRIADMAMTGSHIIRLYITVIKNLVVPAFGRYKQRAAR